MKREVESYIIANMKRALVLWNRAQEAYQEDEIQSAANLYAEAMQLYYRCAKDLINGVGFKEVE